MDLLNGIAAADSVGVSYRLDTGLIQVSYRPHTVSYRSHTGLILQKRSLWSFVDCGLVHLVARLRLLRLAKRKVLCELLLMAMCGFHSRYSELYGAGDGLKVMVAV